MLTAALAQNDGNLDAGEVALVVLAVIFGLAQLILWISAAVSILRKDRLTGGGKFLWFVVIIAFPFLGCLGWFLFGRNAKLVKDGVPPPAHP